MEDPLAFSKSAPAYFCTNATDLAKVMDCALRVVQHKIRKSPANNPSNQICLGENNMK